MQATFADLTNANICIILNQFIVNKPPDVRSKPTEKMRSTLRHFVIFNRKILRMKEFERERRLRLRAYKKDQAEALAAAREAREAMDDDE